MILHLQIIPLRETKPQLNLVRLRLAADVLQIDEFRHTIMDKYVVAAAHAREPEAKSLDQSDQMRKANIAGAAYDLTQ